MFGAEKLSANLSEPAYEILKNRDSNPDSIHETSQYANDRAVLSHQPTRVREPGMRKFKPVEQAQQTYGACTKIPRRTIGVHN